MTSHHVEDLPRLLTLHRSMVRSHAAARRAGEQPSVCPRWQRAAAWHYLLVEIPNVRARVAIGLRLKREGRS